MPIGAGDRRGSSTAPSPGPAGGTVVVVVVVGLVVAGAVVAGAVVMGGAALMTGSVGRSANS
jgi:hypothetical protein